MTWYLAYSKPRQEQTVVQELCNQGYQAYAPLRAKRRRLGRSAIGGGAKATEFMFPRYVFFQPGRPGQSIAPVRSTRGVNHLVSFGHGPVRVPAAVVEQVRAVEALLARTEPLGPDPVPVGSHVQLASPELQALHGLVTAVAGERITILLSILGREKSLTVRHDQIQLC
jgi:transcriptional antiterminator RfaH